MRARVARAMASVTGCNKEGYGNSGKSNGDKGGGQAKSTKATAAMMARMWAMVTVTRWEGDKEGKGKGGKGKGNSGKGGG
jgi:hypothetical protein